MSASTRSEDVLIDLSPRAKLRLSGADRVRFLNGQVSNDMRKASASESVYTCVMTIKGKMCADAFVHAGEDFLLVDTEPELRESLAARLERYIIADDVEMADVTDDWQLFHILPAADDGKNTAAGPRLDDLPGDPVDAGKLHVVQSSRFGRAGIDLFVPILLADAYRSYLGGKFRFLSAEEAEHTRIAAGVPRWGVELGEDTMPAEAGLESRAVELQQGLLHRAGSRFTSQECRPRKLATPRISHRRRCSLGARDDSPCCSRRRRPPCWQHHQRFPTRRKDRRSGCSARRRASRWVTCAEDSRRQAPVSACFPPPQPLSAANRWMPSPDGACVGR